MHALLLPWKNWNQKTDPGDAGEPSLNRYNDCGEESVAEVIWHITGVELEADYIKDAMYGENYVGYSDAQHLTQYLDQKSGIYTRVETPENPKSDIQYALLQGHPVIQLFYFDVVHLTGGHWCPIVECGDAHVVRSNPWIGLQETFAWDEFQRIKQNVTLVCNRKRCIAY